MSNISRAKRAKRHYVKPTNGVSSLRDVFLRCTVPEIGGCWNWNAGTVHGMPYLWTVNLDNGRKCGVTGPRALWYIAHNQPLGERVAWMACGNRRCMFHQHVRSGTRSEYFQLLASRDESRFGAATEARAEAAARGRAKRGIIDLPEHTVRQVQALSATTRNRDIAAATGISLSAVGRILNGHTYRHITGITKRQVGRGTQRKVPA
jgi:hypothetical protein